MEFSIWSGDVSFDNAPELVKEIHVFWLDIYERSPVMGWFVILMIPVTLLYCIYTLGTIFRKERSTDEQVRNDLKNGKRSKKGRKK